MKKKEIGVADILLLILSSALLLGVLTVFAPCGPKEDGGWMTCHWAGNAVAGVAAALTACAVARILVGKARFGLDFAMIAMAALATQLPGRLIPLCMMADMRCRAVMKPAATVCAVLIIAAALWDILARARKAES